jgi:ornithine cyclodeaminase
MLILDADATAAALPMHALVEALRAMFARGCEAPPRQVLAIPAGDGTTLTSLLMPAWLPGAGYGVKTVNVAPANAARGLPAVHAAYTLFDVATGAPRALIDGTTLTNRRTAAASALAASFAARADARTLLIVGAGQIAALLPEAMRCVRPIERVRIWARRRDAAAALAASLRERGFDAAAVTDLEGAASSADIVSCATTATAPVVHGRWLGAGSHLDLIGSFTPAMREADDDCWRDAAVFVDTDEALAKSGDLVAPLGSGALDRRQIRGTLAALCRGEVPGRRDAAERTVFKSVGTALEDLAAALLAVGPR